MLRRAALLKDTAEDRPERTHVARQHQGPSKGHFNPSGHPAGRDTGTTESPGTWMFRWMSHKVTDVSPSTGTRHLQSRYPAPSPLFPLRRKRGAGKGLGLRSRVCRALRPPRTWSSQPIFWGSRGSRMWVKTLQGWRRRNRTFCNQLPGENPSQALRFRPRLLSIYSLSSPKRCWIPPFPARPSAAAAVAQRSARFAACWRPPAQPLRDVLKLLGAPGSCCASSFEKRSWIHRPACKDGARNPGKGTEREPHAPGTGTGTRYNGEVSREGDES